MPVTAGDATKGTALTARLTSSARMALPAALVLGAAVALSGCGAQPGAAAIVNDRVISNHDAQVAADQTNAAVPGLQQKLTPANTLVSLILAPYVLAKASASGHGVSVSQAEQILAKVPNPAASTVEFVRTQLALQSLSPQDQQAILDEVGKAKITVSPRYGTFDPKKLALDTNARPNWISKDSATPTTSASGQ